MLPDERFRRILEIIRKNQSVTVQELVKQIGISESTVRRDLAALDKKGLLHKVHGGCRIWRRRNSCEEIFEKCG